MIIIKSAELMDVIRSAWPGIRDEGTCHHPMNAKDASFR